MATPFTYAPSHHVPFRDVEAIERCRNIKTQDLAKHANPDFKIRIMPGDDILQVVIADMVYWMKKSDDQDQRVVLMLPNPCPQLYSKVAMMVNKLRINCRNVVCFALDEYANEHGQIAPVEWEFGFTHSMVNSLWGGIDEDLRMPREHVFGPTTQNIAHYSQMMADFGGVDMSYTGPGWTGHVAFVEPDAPEFEGTLEEWKQMGARVCTLSPFTLAQNSLHGCFGLSGDIAKVPPMAATIGPADVIAARNRIELHALTIQGTASSWQRLMSRLCLHGPVCPQLPTSLHQELRTDVYVSPEIAANIETDWSKGY